jgi:hypothetical protein
MKRILTTCSLTLVPLIMLLAMSVGGDTPAGLDVVKLLSNSSANSTTEIVSSVENVTVTRYSILSPHSLGIDLTYSGSGKGPAVKVESSAISIKSKLVEDITNQISEINPNSTDSNASNFAKLIDQKLAELSGIVSVSNGTKTLDSGWKSPTSIMVDLKGNATLNGTEFVGVAVHK